MHHSLVNKGLLIRTALIAVFSHLVLFLIAAAIASAQQTAALPKQAAAHNPDERAIRAAIEHYFQGLITGVGSHYRIAFHPEARLFQVVRDGRLFAQSSEDYAANAAPPSEEELAQAKLRIISIDQTLTAAVVKVELDLPELTFVDYMSMLKIEGEWRIMNKISAAVHK